MSASLESFVFAFILATAAALLVTGCGNKDPELAQVIATVDGEDINMRQMSEALARSEGVTPENISDVKLRILDALVEQQLAVNLAVSKKLDHKPEVLGAIEASRRQILAQAALDQIASEQPLISDDDAKKYLANNAALFSERRIFSLQEVTLKKSAVNPDQLRAQMGVAKRMDDMVAWLKDKKIEFDSGGSIRPAEQIAPDVLTKLQAMKEGQFLLVEDANALTITRLVSMRTQAIPSSKALPAAITQLSRQRTADAIDRVKLEMRTKAKLAYFGEFVGGEAAFKERAEADAKIAATADARARTKARAEGEALAEQIANQQADSQSEQDARDKARVSSGKWQAPTKAEAIILEQGIKGL